MVLTATIVYNLIIKWEEDFFGLLFQVKQSIMVWGGSRGTETGAWGRWPNCVYSQKQGLGGKWRRARKTSRPRLHWSTSSGEAPLLKGPTTFQIVLCWGPQAHTLSLLGIFHVEATGRFVQSIKHSQIWLFLWTRPSSKEMARLLVFLTHTSFVGTDRLYKFLFWNSSVLWLPVLLLPADV